MILNNSKVLASQGYLKLHSSSIEWACLEEIDYLYSLNWNLRSATIAPVMTDKSVGGSKGKRFIK